MFWGFAIHNLRSFIPSGLNSGKNYVQELLIFILSFINSCFSACEGRPGMGEFWGCGRQEKLKIPPTHVLGSLTPSSTLGAWDQWQGMLGHGRVREILGVDSTLYWGLPCSRGQMMDWLNTRVEFYTTYFQYTVLAAIPFIVLGWCASFGHFPQHSLELCWFSTMYPDRPEGKAFWLKT